MLMHFAPPIIMIWICYSHSSGRDQANAILTERRRIVPPIMPKPAIIIAHVAGYRRSGMDDGYGQNSGTPCQKYASDSGRLARGVMVRS